MMPLVEVGVLVALASPLLRAATHPALRRAFPNTAATIAFVVVAVIVGAASIGLWFPGLLHALTAFAVVGALYSLWHARPSYGRSRRLPPGSLSLLPFGYIMDPFFFQKQIERYGTPFKVNQFGIGASPNPFRGVLRPVCCVDLQLGIKILHAYDDCLIPPPIPSSRFIPKNYLREMKPEDHRRYRSLFSSAFDSNIVDESTAFITQHIRSSLLQMADESSSNGNRGIPPEPSILGMTFGVFVRCFLGIFPDDERFGRLQKLTSIIDLTNRNDREVTRALDELAQILRQEAHRVVTLGLRNILVSRALIATAEITYA
jgi:cytochrome P450